jgi:hypothetical protein
MQSFIRMYRPHEAWEDTVLFPEVRRLLREKELRELGDVFEERERQLFGENGFEREVAESPRSSAPSVSATSQRSRPATHANGA